MQPSVPMPAWMQPQPPAQLPAATTLTLPVVEPSQGAGSDPLRKVAVLLIALGEEASGHIIKELIPEEVQKVSRAVSQASAIPFEESVSVLREFQQLLMARTFVLNGGMDYASRMLRGAFGGDRARHLLDQVSQAIGSESSFDALQQAEPRQLANLVHSEHPQTIAVILSHLNPWQASSLLNSLSPDLRMEVAMRMAKIEQIAPEVVGKITQTVAERLQGLGDMSRRSYGGVRALAEVLNRLEGSVRNEMLTQLADRDSKLAASIRDLMFVFEDLASVDGRGVKLILAEADPRTVAAALKGSSEALRIHFFRNMSSEGAAMLREDIEGIGPVKLRDVEAAQQQIIALARDLEAKGSLSLNNYGDTYVP